MAPLSSQIEQNGQQLIRYNGKWTLAVKGNDGKLRVYDDKLGKFIEVDPNDLFGMNKKFEEDRNAMIGNLDASFNEQIKSSNKWIDYYTTMQTKYKELYSKATGAIDAARKAWNTAYAEHEEAEHHYNNIVGQTKTGNIEDLSADAQIEAQKYAEQMHTSSETMTTEDNNRSKARSKQITADYFIRGYAIDLISEYSHKNNVQNQQTVAHHTLGIV